MKKAMDLSPNISLPIEAITQTFGVIGIKGSGKTYFAGKLYELFYAEGVQCIVLDPVGLWYGLRLNKAGTGASNISAPVFGGLHGDVPLTQDSAKVVASWLLESGSSAILDVSQFRKGVRKEFVADLCEELFHAQKKRRTPLHLFIDEAQIFVPQRPSPGEQRMLGAMEDIVRLGRNFGIGVTLISQRPQSVNKEVLNQVEPLIVFQLAAAHERKAVEDWIVYSGADVKNELRSLSALQKGEGYFWSPSWMQRFEKFRCHEKETFDATATPTLGQKAAQPVELSPTDISNLSDKIKSMAERIASKDPAALEKKITELQRQLRQHEGCVTAAELKRQIAQAVAEDRASRNDAPIADQGLAAAFEKIRKIVTSTGGTVTPPPAKYTANRAPATPIVPVAGKPSGSGEQRILNSVAWWESTGIAAPYSKIKVAFIAGYKPGSGGYNNLLGKLRSAGLIEYPTAGNVALTDAGRAAADPINAPASQEELHARVMEKLNGPQQKVLSWVISTYPESISKPQLADFAGYSAGSGGFNNIVGSLRTLSLIDYPSPGIVKAEDFLFIGGDL